MDQREYCEDFKCFEFALAENRCKTHCAPKASESEMISPKVEPEMVSSNPLLAALVGRWRCEAGYLGGVRHQRWDTDVLEIRPDGEEQLSVIIDARIGGRTSATLVYLYDSNYLLTFLENENAASQTFCRIGVHEGKLNFVRDENKDSTVEFDPHSLTTSRTIWVREKEPELHTRVELHSLNTAKYNSQQGVILSREDARYRIRLDSGHELRVKPENVRPVAALSLSIKALESADVRTVAQCLRAHSSLSSSFQRGAEASPDYVAIVSAISNLLTPSPCTSSSSTCSDLPKPTDVSAPPSSSESSTSSSPFASFGSDSATPSLPFASFGSVSAPSSSFASFGSDESTATASSSSTSSSTSISSAPSELSSATLTLPTPDARMVLMDALSELLSTVFHTEKDAPTMFCLHKESGVSPWEQLEELKPAEGGPACSCSLLAMAAAVPLLENSLPTDKEGVCFVPHQHPMQKQRAPPGTPSFWNTLTNKYCYQTQRICDRCMTPVDDPDFYHCGKGCDVDFCNTCQQQIERILQVEGKAPAEAQQSLERAMRRILWSVHTLDLLARQVLVQSVAQRRALAQQLAAEWPDELFQRLVKVVTDVCNGRIMFNCNSGALSTAVREGPNGQYIQDVLPVYEEPRFWYVLGLLQFLVSCNQLPRPGVSQSELRPKIPETLFTLHGMNKVHDNVEWKHWQSAPFTLAPFAMLRVPRFACDSHFASLVIHHNLLPIEFRRRCLLQNVCDDRVVRKIKLVVSREPAEMVEDVVAALVTREEDGSRSSVFGVLSASFKGEIAEGPGVLRDFFQVSLRSFLTKLFVPTDNRSFWFNTEVDLPDYFFACGALLALALLHQIFVPRVFPETLFFLLLHHIGSPYAAQLSLAQLADVSPAEARSLQQVLDYGSDDIGEVFGDLGWERTGSVEALTQATKRQLVQDYLEWSLTTKIAAQFGPFAEGFQNVLNAPKMLRGMITSTHLQNILCSTECEVNVAALRASSLSQDWGPNDEAYLDMFWEVLDSFPQAIKEQFLVFVTASNQVPLGGWGDLHIVVKKNGVGDERLPAAYTCFNLILLPRYSTQAILQARLLKAISESSGFGLK